MHIRSRTSEADLQRTRERRAWCCLGLCLAAGIGAAAAALHIPHAGTATVTSSRPDTSAWLVEEAPPQKAQPVEVHVPDITPPEITPELLPATLPAVAVEIPSPALPELEDLPETAPAEDILPMPELPLPATPARPAIANQQPPPQPHAAVAKAESQTPFIPPAYKNAPSPPYPSALRAGRIEGDVRVRIAVDAAGNPTRVEVISGSGHREFDTTARDWILKHWQFTPARQGGRAIAGTVTTSVRFVLR